MKVCICMTKFKCRNFTNLADASKNSTNSEQMKMNILVVGTLLGFSDASRGSKSLPTLSCSATRHSMLDLRTLLLSLDSKHCNGHHTHHHHHSHSYQLVLLSSFKRHQKCSSNLLTKFVLLQLFWVNSQKNVLCLELCMKF